MRKLLIFTVLMLLISCNLFSQYAVDSTRTMDSDHLSDLRDACDGGDDIMTKPLATPALETKTIN